MKNLLAHMNWKTSSAGIGLGLMVLGKWLYSGEIDWESGMAAAAALGLIAARDGDKSSRSVGAK